MGRSRAESDIALLLAGPEHECVSQPSVPGTVIPMMPNTLLLNVALRDGRLEGLRLLRWRTHTRPPEAGHKRSPSLLRSFAERPPAASNDKAALSLSGCSASALIATLSDGIRSSISETRNWVSSSVTFSAIRFPSTRRRNVV